ncbi:hypothetical protein SNE40_004541 [Patella caerulea]|uniref:HTH CENPB-type domain-containing protein n=1 Tax=Patella caerulea TaxID=87958 RepID=A0AAN8JYB2_PATCE
MSQSDEKGVIKVKATTPMCNKDFKSKPPHENYMVFNISDSSVTTVHNRITTSADTSALSVAAMSCGSTSTCGQSSSSCGSGGATCGPACGPCGPGCSPCVPKQKPRTDLPLSEKLRLIQVSEATGKSQRNLAQEFNISLGSVNNILKRKKEYQDAYENNEIPLNCKNFRRCKKGEYLEDLNKLVLRWIGIAQSKNILLNGAMIQEKAKDFATKLGVSFTPSNVWLSGLKKKFNIQLRTGGCDCADPGSRIFSTWAKMLPYQVQGCEPENIFTCGETALFYKGLPDRCYVDGTVCFGSHHNLDFTENKLTILFCCSAAGEKLKPLVVAKESRPPSLQDCNMDELPVRWLQNKNSCMTAEIFSNWLRELDEQLEQQDRHIALFMEMIPGHLASVVLKNISIKYYLDNSGTFLQPLQQGILTNFKAHYRRRFLQAVLARNEYNEDTRSVLQDVTELDAVYWIKQSWNNVRKSTVASCFEAVGFAADTGGEEWEDNNPTDLIELVEETGMAFKFMPMFTEVYLQFDSQIPCHVYETEDWESQLIQEAMASNVKMEPEEPTSETSGQNQRAINQSNESSTSSQTRTQEIVLPDVTQEDALSSLKNLKIFAKGDSVLLDKIYHLEISVLNHITKLRKNSNPRLRKPIFFHKESASLNSSNLPQVQVHVTEKN